MNKDRALHFASLHRKGDPLILFNVWDAGSARIVADAGAPAIATGSWSVAAAQGFEDGEAMPLELALANLARITAAVALPVTLDFEGGYAREPAKVAENAMAVVDAGAVGCNFEDGLPGGGLFPIDEQCRRIDAIRKAADKAGFPFFINARTDIFLISAPEEHAGRHEEALARGEAFARAGANGFFVPGLGDETLIEATCSLSPLPVNIMTWEGRTPPAKRLAELGVARISHAGAPWRIAMQALAEAARAAHLGA